MSDDKQRDPSTEPGTACAAKGVRSPSTLRGVLAKSLQCRTPARVRSCVTQTSLRHLSAQ